MKIMTAKEANHNFKKYGPFRIFDKNGNSVYFEDSKGYWAKSEYINNNEVYFENSNGEWEKRRYDIDDNENYYEDSNGNVKRGINYGQFNC